MQKLIWSALILGAASSAAFAIAGGPCVVTPEIDANTGLAALGLIGGAVLVIRSRRKK